MLKNSSKMIRKGKCILKEQPFVYVLKSKYRKERCDHCFKTGPSWVLFDLSAVHINYNIVVQFVNLITKHLFLMGFFFIGIHILQWKSVEMLWLPICLLLQSWMPNSCLEISQDRMHVSETSSWQNCPRCSSRYGPNYTKIERWRWCRKRILYRELLSQIQRSNVT